MKLKALSKISVGQQPIKTDIVYFSMAGIFFKLARCGYTLRVTSQASYSPEYITPTEKKQ
jgi:hypothetical protein